MTERELIGRVEAMMDTSVLREFLTMLGPEGSSLLRGLVETYLKEAPPVIEDLGETLGHADHAGAARLAHRLKGSSLSIGASRLATRCGVIEEICNVRLTPPAAAYAALIADFTETRRMLKAFLKEIA
ncbi:MAG: Hpt domain-containing protein [Chloroflexales bacterium]|nr:Hpt domain-containing protein [Chloroflexales bacterium]